MAPVVMTRLKGGLGNQMFQYAAGLALATRHGVPLVLDRSFLDARGRGLRHTLREYELDAFGIDATGRRCLDAGASTGGFTQVLLERGAAEVVAVDVGYGQLAWPLRSDPRVTVIERTNVRDLTPETIGGPVFGIATGRG